ncbi:MAG: hypothetical protein ILO42_06380 [Clostridia bacterium]|nr:hypothetical protein [Clostridia bacterium]
MSDRKTTAGKIVKQGICYLAGLILIAIGITFSKLSSLGISPVSSIPRACELIWGFTLGTTTFIVYCVLILAQLAVLRRKFTWRNLLGLPLTFVFSWLVDLFGTDPNAFGHLMIWLPKPESYIMRLVYTLTGIVIIGIGVFLYLRPHWVPMPAEGLAGAISTVTKYEFGNCKTAVDCSMIAIALLLQLIFLGGFSSFTGDRVVVREGTVLAAVCVGQIVKFLSKKLGGKVDKIIGK